MGLHIRWVGLRIQSIGLRIFIFITKTIKMKFISPKYPLNSLKEWIEKPFH